MTGPYHLQRPLDKMTKNGYNGGMVINRKWFEVGQKVVLVVASLFLLLLIKRTGRVLAFVPEPGLVPLAGLNQEQSGIDFSSTMTVQETSLVIPAYPYLAYLRADFDERYNVPFHRLERAAYDAAQPAPRDTTLKAIVLENEYLQLTILPELGGRLYSCRFKPGGPSGREIFYHNPVLKPSYWGPFAREENWWLAAGGMEWALPVSEHGYEWGEPWNYAIAQTAEEVSVTVWDSGDENRLRAQVTIGLPAGAAYFSLRPRLENTMDKAANCQFWINAMLTLGHNSVSPNTRFVCPTDQVWVHSTGDPSLPQAGESMSWPRYHDRDLSLYGHWKDWLGLFAHQPLKDFAGAYNYDTDLGVVRIFPAQEVRGVKFFAFGTEFQGRYVYTDDDSNYFELWGGPNRTFWPEDDISLPPQSSLEWTEYWYPLSGIHGLDYANLEAALSLQAEEEAVTIGAITTRPRTGVVSLSLDSREIFAQETSIGPDTPFFQTIPLETSIAGHLILRLSDETGAIIAQYDTCVACPAGENSGGTG